MRLIDADALLNDPDNISSNEFGDDIVYVDDINNSPTIDIPQWILCTDRLPDKDGDYIVSHLFCGEPEVGKSWFNTKNGFTFGMVYAWMPLPEPCNYKKEQKLFNRKTKEGDQK